MKPRKLLNVLPECYVDTNLIEYLLNAGVNHQHCCSKVVGQLKTTFAEKIKFNWDISKSVKLWLHQNI